MKKSILILLSLVLLAGVSFAQTKKTQPKPKKKPATEKTAPAPALKEVKKEEEVKEVENEEEEVEEIVIVKKSAPKKRIVYVEEEERALRDNFYSAGLGIGSAYGMLGVNVEYHLIKNYFSFFSGFGSVIGRGLGFSIGARSAYYFGEYTNVRLTGMWGPHLAVELQKNRFSNETETKIDEGLLWTIGFGIGLFEGLALELDAGTTLTHSIDYDDLIRQGYVFSTPTSYLKNRLTIALGLRYSFR